MIVLTPGQKGERKLLNVGEDIKINDAIDIN